MERLNEEIKSGQLRQIYLLYGEETYLVRQYRDKLKDALIDDGDSMNYHYFEGKDINIGEIIDLAETMPFLADKRVIVIENSGLFKRGGEQLAEYLKEPSETAFFVLVEREIDKRSRLFKAVSEKGHVVEFKTQKDDILKRWILGILKKENKKITKQDLELFLEKTGTNMENISKELEKVVCYCIDKEVITGEDIEKICTRQVSNQIFNMVEAIAEKRQQDAMELYYDLLMLEERPIGILSLLARQFRLLFQVRELKKKGYSSKEIEKIVGLYGNVVRKFEKQAAKFSGQELRRAMNDCAEMDEAIKTGKMDGELSVGLLIVRYSI